MGCYDRNVVKMVEEVRPGKSVGSKACYFEASKCSG
jgi:hypothetical protein